MNVTLITLADSAVRIVINVVSDVLKLSSLVRVQMFCIGSVTCGVFLPQCHLCFKGQLTVILAFYFTHIDTWFPIMSYEK